MLEIKQTSNENRYIDKSKITLEEWLKKWIKIHKKPYIKPRTLQGYIEKIKFNIVPFIGQYPFQELDTLFFQEYFSDLAMGNEKRGIKQYSPKTIREIKSILNMAYEDGIVDKLVSANPINHIKTPKVIRKRRNNFNTEQIMNLMIILLQEGIRGLFYLFILNTGVRSSEDGGLKWKHYNYDNSEVEIEDGFGLVTLYDDDFNKIETITEDKDLKTQPSYRTIPLQSWLNELLYYYMQYVLNEKGITSKNEIDDCYIFTNNLGNPLTSDYLGDTLDKILNKHDFPHTNPRNLRHLFATMCVNAGITINQLQNYLGHALASTTLNYYVDSDKKRNKEEIVKLEQSYMGTILVKELDNMKLTLLKGGMLEQKAV